jgi:hypothetical protein
MLPQLPGQRAHEGGQHRTVRPRQARPVDLATQHRDLMAQHHQLDEDRGLAPRYLRQPAKHPNRSQVQQPNNHATHPARQLQTPAHTPCEQFWHGTGSGLASWQTSTRRQRILEPAQIRALDKGTALLLATGIPVALIRLLPWYDGPHAKALGVATTEVTQTITARARTSYRTTP